MECRYTLILHAYSEYRFQTTSTAWLDLSNESPMGHWVFRNALSFWITLNGIRSWPDLPQLAARVSHNGWHKVTFTSVNYLVLCLVAPVVELWPELSMENICRHGSVLWIRSQMKREDPLNLSILLRGGKETNKDSPSNGEWSGKSSTWKSISLTACRVVS